MFLGTANIYFMFLFYSIFHSCLIKKDTIIIIIMEKQPSPSFVSFWRCFESNFPPKIRWPPGEKTPHGWGVGPASGVSAAIFIWTVPFRWALVVGQGDPGWPRVTPDGIQIEDEKWDGSGWSMVEFLGDFGCLMLDGKYLSWWLKLAISWWNAECYRFFSGWLL